MLIQTAPLVAVHEQPASVLTETLPLPAFRIMDALRRDSECARRSNHREGVALATLE